MKKHIVVLSIVSVLMIGFMGITYGQPTMPGYTPGASIYDSWHNLGFNGPNPALRSAAVAAGGTTEVCVYCHTPHNAVRSRILWNRQDFNPSLYNVATVDFDSNAPGIPGGDGLGKATTDKDTPWNNVTITRFSLRCFTCHDGSTSVGQVNFAYTATGGAATHFTPGTALPMTGADQASGIITNSLFLLGSTFSGSGNRDMSGNHPVSIPYPGSTYNSITSGITVDGGSNMVPAAQVLANVDGEALRGAPGTYGIECGSCHDTHAQQSSTNSTTLPGHLNQMIRVGMENSNLCFGCHAR